MDAKEIGRRLKILRGRTPGREVCKAVGISRSTLSMYEQGQRIPRMKSKANLRITIKRLCKKYFMISFYPWSSVGYFFNLYIF